MAYRNRGALESFAQLNFLVALSLSAFSVFGLIQAGLMQMLIDWLTQTQHLTTVGALVCLLIIFASSETRDPRHYHPVEFALVGLAVAAMLAHAFVPSIQNTVVSNQPWAGISLMTPWVLAGVIVGR